MPLLKHALRTATAWSPSSCSAVQPRAASLSRYLTWISLSYSQMTPRGRSERECGATSGIWRSTMASSSRPALATSCKPSPNAPAKRSLLLRLHAQRSAIRQCPQRLRLEPGRGVLRGPHRSRQRYRLLRHGVGRRPSPPGAAAARPPSGCLQRHHFAFTCQVLLSLTAYIVLPDATRYAMGTLKHSLHSYYFCHTLRTTALDEEVAFFQQRLGESHTLKQLLNLGAIPPVIWLRATLPSGADEASPAHDPGQHLPYRSSQIATCAMNSASRCRSAGSQNLSYCAATARASL